MDKRREQLETLRDLLAGQLVDAKPGELPGLAREYRATLKDLADLPAAEKVSKIDEIADRRKARRAAAAG